MKTFHTLVAVAGIAAAAGIAYWYQNVRPERAVAAQSADAMPSRGAAASRGAGEAVTVEVAKVERRALQDDVNTVGSVRSLQSVVLRPEVSGRIDRLGFADGQRVRKGQVLVQLDDTLQQAQLMQAQAQASIARTNLQRNRELIGENFVSQSAVDQSAAALEVAMAQVALAKAQVTRMRIVAPFDGIAGIATVDVGDYVKEGGDIVGIEDVSAMFVDFRLPERSLGRLRTGQDVEVSLDGMPGRSFTGKVEALDSQLDANGRSLLVRARLDNREGRLRSGMFARARIVFAVRENAIVVPEEALVPQGGKQYLLKVVDGPNGKTTQRLEAKVGLRIPGKVEILEGLAAGDLVVTAGQGPLLRADGLPVRVVEVGGKAESAPLPATGASGVTSGGPASASTLLSTKRRAAAV